jgi:hypothetical protein
MERKFAVMKSWAKIADKAFNCSQGPNLLSAPQSLQYTLGTESFSHGAHVFIVINIMILRIWNSTPRIFEEIKPVREGSAGDHPFIVTNAVNFNIRIPLQRIFKVASKDWSVFDPFFLSATEFRIKVSTSLIIATPDSVSADPPPSSPDYRNSHGAHLSSMISPDPPHITSQHYLPGNTLSLPSSLSALLNTNNSFGICLSR